MSQSMPVLQKTFLAATDLSTLQWTFVKMSADQTVTGAGAGEQAIGVLTNMPAAVGRGAVVRLLGTTKIKCNGASPNIVAGYPLKSGANGVGVYANTNKDIVNAIALAGSTADGDLVECLLASFVINK